MRSDPPTPSRPSRLETLGGWLGLWTPPRGVVLPPPPWGRIALALGAFTVAVAVPLGLVVREAAENRARAERTEARERAALRAERDRRIAAEARPRRAVIAPRATTGTPAARRAARAGLVTALEARVAADATRRARAGELRAPVERVECEPFPRTAAGTRPEDDPSRRRAGYACLAITAEARPGPVSGEEGPGNAPSEIGYPFRAVVDFATGRLTWCRVSGRPAEGALRRDTVVVLPRACKE